MQLLKKFSNIPGLTHAFSESGDGNMSFGWGDHTEVLANRERFLSKLGLAIEDGVTLSLMHGVDVRQVAGEDRGRGMTAGSSLEADAMITTEKGLVLFLLTADCFPILFYSPNPEVIALAHCGRKSTEAHLAAKVVKELVDTHGCDPKKIIAGIGPGIHKESYVFLKDQVEAVVAADSTLSTDSRWKPFLYRLPNGELSIDLIGYNKQQLLEVGVKEENIEISDSDTAINKNFFSHYRSIRTGEPEGRFCTVISLLNQQ